MDFKSLALKPELTKAVESLGYETPTDIQAQAIPTLIDNPKRDLVAQAQTGTGKTAAFLLPLLQQIDTDSRKVQALILAPTRELAQQVHAELEKFAKFSKVRSLIVFGGSSYDKQINSLRTKFPHIVVGTPGRTLDLIQKKAVLSVSNAGFFILDEADEMLNMGFAEDVETLMELMPPDRASWMFSATLPPSISKIIKKNFNDPYFIKAKAKKINSDNIKQYYYSVKHSLRAQALYNILKVEDDIYGIIFCQTKIETQELGDSLTDHGFNTTLLHGDMGQAERTASMTKFKAKKAKILVCTDVAARGIDVNDLTHVINFGLPRSSESYVHRIGRTGRAGKTGVAINIISPREFIQVKRIEKITKVSMKEGKLPTKQDVKKSLVRRELKAFDPIIERLQEKGEAYTVDPNFVAYEEKFKELSRDEILKLFFTKQLNDSLRQLDKAPPIKMATRGENTAASQRNGGGRDRRRRSGGRDSGGRDRRRSGGRRSEGKPGSGGGERRRTRRRRPSPASSTRG